MNKAGSNSKEANIGILGGLDKVLEQRRKDEESLRKLSAKIAGNSDMQKLGKAHAEAMKSLESAMYSLQGPSRELRKVYNFFDMTRDVFQSTTFTLTRTMQLYSDSLSQYGRNTETINQFGEVVEKYEGSYVNLSDVLGKPRNIEGSVETSISEIKPDLEISDTISLTTTTVQTAELGIAQFQMIQQMRVDMGSMKNTQEQMYNFQIQDSKQKEETIQELLNYIKAGGKCIFPITSIKYLDKSSELIVDGKKIPLKRDTTETIVCSILCSDKEKLQLGWNIDEIVGLMGTDPDYLDKSAMQEWKDKIYRAVRRLNDKIATKTTLENFFLCSSVALLNPKYSTMNDSA